MDGYTSKQAQSPGRHAVTPDGEHYQYDDLLNDFVNLRHELLRPMHEVLPEAYKGLKSINIHNNYDSEVPYISCPLQRGFFRPCVCRITNAPAGPYI